MENQEILSLIRSVASKVLDEEVEFDERTPIKEVQDWDSLNNMHIVVRIEKKLGIEFVESDFQDVVLIGDLVKLISNRIPTR